MIEDELIQIWQSSSKQERIKFEKSKLMLAVQSRLDSFHKAVVRRDWMEIGTGIVMIPVFTYQIFNQTNLLAKFGALWIVVYIIFVIYKLRKAKNSKPLSTEGSYLDYLKKNKNYLQTQKQLLDSILFWYILPGLTGVTIMFIGILGLVEKSWEAILNLKMVWIGFLVFTSIGVFIYRLNKWAVKKEFIPRIKEVNELIQLMEEEL